MDEVYRRDRPDSTYKRHLGSLQPSFIGFLPPTIALQCYCYIISLPSLSKRHPAHSEMLISSISSCFSSIYSLLFLYFLFYFTIFILLTIVKRHARDAGFWSSTTGSQCKIFADAITGLTSRRTTHSTSRYTSSGVPLSTSLELN